ncbi:PTS sugar transporter subunit IIA [uncultured Anaerococcus sp.]|uniref:PTS sugar transporter subunit IIA n=1 Tax=uncultured Anaerococcus sp. TaxID=293428 RepID=UPI00263A3739|nr:PTS fructose transporter subunit IIBC [uncultured Anaerococcus sp.]
MRGIILTTHGNLASGLYSTIKMVAGEFNNIKIVEFHDGDDLEKLDMKIENAYKDLDYEKIVVLADLAGGTPFNRSVMTLSNKDNVQFLAGVNFAMLYQALSSEIDEDGDFLDDIIKTSKQSIISYNVEPETSSNEMDGI